MARSRRDLDPRYGCEGKERFIGLKLAKRAASRKPRRHPYHCPICKGWHVGTRVSRPPMTQYKREKVRL